jgi:hypothetical protein
VGTAGFALGNGDGARAAGNGTVLAGRGASGRDGMGGRGASGRDSMGGRGASGRDGMGGREASGRDGMGGRGASGRDGMGGRGIVAGVFAAAPGRMGSGGFPPLAAAAAGRAEGLGGGIVGASSSSRSSGPTFCGRTLGNAEGDRGVAGVPGARSGTEGGGTLDAPGATDVPSSAGGLFEGDAPPAVLRSSPSRFFAAQVFGSAPRFFCAFSKWRTYVPFSISRQIRVQCCWNVL